LARSRTVFDEFTYSSLTVITNKKLNVILNDNDKIF